MKRFLPLAAGLVLATSVFAAEDKPSFEISARYEGFDPSLLAETNFYDPLSSPDGALLAIAPGKYLQNSSAKSASGVQSAPRVTTRAGQRATIEIIQEHLVPTADEPQHVNCGVTLSLTPELKDGKVMLFGQSVVRHQVNPGSDQPLHAQSFTTRETFFNGEVTEGQDYVIRVGENPQDPARITLTVKRAPLPAPVTHAGPPRFHVYALQPSPEEAKKPIYRQLRLGPEPDAATPFAAESLRKRGLVVWGVFDPSQLARSDKDGPVLPSPEALQPISDADAPFKMTGTVGADGNTVDIHLEPTGKLAGLTSADVSIWWGSEVYLGVNDASQPNGRRILIVKQD